VKRCGKTIEKGSVDWRKGTEMDETRTDNEAVAEVFGVLSVFAAWNNALFDDRGQATHRTAVKGE
jgi:hypothetical protein